MHDVFFFCLCAYPLRWLPLVFATLLFFVVTCTTCCTLGFTPVSSDADTLGVATFRIKKKRAGHVRLVMSPCELSWELDVGLCFLWFGYGEAGRCFTLFEAVASVLEMR